MALTDAASMMIACHAVIVRMIRQSLDDAAFCCPPAFAGLDHGFEFELQSGKPSDPPLYVVEMCACDFRDRLAGLFRIIGEFEKLADRGLRKTEFATVTDEVEARQVFRPI